MVPELKAKGLRLSIDSFATPVQRWALAQGVDYLNDIHGFPDAALYPELAQSHGQADRDAYGAAQAAWRCAPRCRPPRSSIASPLSSMRASRRWTEAGIARDRLILDPGMGQFLGTDPENSLIVLRRLPELKRPLRPAAAGVGVAQGLPAQAGQPAGGPRRGRRHWRRNCSPRRKAPTISAPMRPGPLAGWR